MGMSNIHKDCEYYVEQNDMCLLYYQLGFFNVSQYNDCVEGMVFDEGKE